MVRAHGGTFVLNGTSLRIRDGGRHDSGMKALNDEATGGGQGVGGGEACERKAGRPRCMEVHRRILSATLEELQAAGWDGLTVEGIAARAGVGKATIYRRWSGRAELLLDALLESAGEELELRDTGDLRHDLRVQMRALVSFFTGPQQATVRAILAAQQSDPVIAASFREKWLLKRKVLASAAIRQAVSRGQLDPETDADLLLDLLYGPLYFRLVLGHDELNGEMVDRLVDQVLPMFGV